MHCLAEALYFLALRILCTSEKAFGGGLFFVFGAISSGAKYCKIFRGVCVLKKKAGCGQFQKEEEHSLGLSATLCCSSAEIET